MAKKPRKLATLEDGKLTPGDQLKDRESDDLVIHEQLPTPLGAKMALVLAEISAIKKTGHNPHFHYDYITEDVLTEQIRPLLADHGIALMFGATHAEDIAPGRVRVWCEFCLLDRDGNEKTVTVPGEGWDERNPDKALPKAMTMATKYWLYKTFMVSTHDDTERDDPAKTQLSPAERKKQQQQQQKKQELTEPVADSELFTTKQREQLEKFLKDDFEYSTQLTELMKKSVTTEGKVTEGSAKRLIAEAGRQRKVAKEKAAKEKAAAAETEPDAEKKDGELEF